MSTSIRRIPIFPTVVYEIDLPPEHYNKLVELCPKLDYKRTEDNSRSLCGVYKNPEFQSFFEWVNSVLKGLMNELYNDPYCDPLEVCASWVNRSEKTERTHEHVHPWSIISGIVYLTGEDGFTTFVKKNPYDSIREMPLSRLDGQPEQVPLLLGKMLLFPSTISHFVTENECDVVRYTLSFNTMPPRLNRSETVQFNN